MHTREGLFVSSPLAPPGGWGGGVEQHHVTRLRVRVGLPGNKKNLLTQFTPNNLPAYVNNQNITCWSEVNVKKLGGGCKGGVCGGENGAFFLLRLLFWGRHLVHL